MHKIIGLIDTASSSSSLGDDIIMESCREFVADKFPEHFQVSFPAHAEINNYSEFKLRQAEHIFVGGTNILCPNYEKYSQWHCKGYSTFINKPILMGAGWNAYSEETSELSQVIHENILNKDYMHSVRDEYTKKKLSEIGINNVINTSCPTLWNCYTQQIGIGSRSAVFTLHYGHKNHSKDLEFINKLNECYHDNLYFWPQGYLDLDYLKELDPKFPIIILNPTVKSLDFAFNIYNCDYAGVRLHAGIRAIQHNKTANIIAIDNRAAELLKDISGYSFTYENFQIANKSKREIELKIPRREKEIWMDQF